MAKNPVARPYAEYLLGLLMSLQRADGGNTIYFLGHIVNSGGWIYFPVLFLLKEPIPTLLIIFIGCILAFIWFVKHVARNKTIVNDLRGFMHYLYNSFPQFSMISFIILYWSYSMSSPLNIGIRHVLPTFPLLYILAACAWRRWVTQINFQSLGDVARSFFASSAKYIFLLVLVVWLTFETLLTAPYFLSYFNEFAGGTWNGYRYITDSNYDWGQDLLRLQSFVAAHPEIDKIAVDYFGGGNPSYYLGSKETDWQSSKGDPADQNIHWLAISVNQLQGGIEPLVPGETRNASDTYSWLTATRPPAPGMGNVPQPDYRIGTSIFVYKL